jgi:monoamine oxidase
VPVRNKTIFNKEVKEIRWDITNGHHKNKVVVECSDGSVYVANHVIVTVSLGVLKETARSMFDPALPKEKLNAIKVSSKYLHILNTCYYFVVNCSCIHSSYLC